VGGLRSGKELNGNEYFMNNSINKFAFRKKVSIPKNLIIQWEGFRSTFV
jgi:hypothetical protein